MTKGLEDRPAGRGVTGRTAAAAPRLASEVGPPRPRVCVVMGTHLTTCPRMLKAADALHEAGYDVRVVSTSSGIWARETDLETARVRGWHWSPVDVQWDTARLRRLWGSARHRVCGRVVALAGAKRSPSSLVARGYSRVHPELVRAILAEPADLIYAGQTAALAAAAEAADRAGVPFALDLEDFHSEEHSDKSEAARFHPMAERIERYVLPRATFLTAGSRAIAEAYEAKYAARPITINNTFPMPSAEPDFSDRGGRGLRLYWFSQVIGPARGLEDVIRGMGKTGVPGELSLRGRPADGYVESLRRLAAREAPSLKVTELAPAPPDAMIDLCREYDCGLALEQAHVLNRRICLTNKAFTYMLAGLGVVLTDTPGQRPIAQDLGPNAIVYAPGDVEALARGLRRWAEDRDALRAARRASWEAARRRWHWEHPLERGALLGAVASVFNGGSNNGGSNNGGSNNGGSNNGGSNEGGADTASTERSGRRD